jgi:hypothetical protein
LRSDKTLNIRGTHLPSFQGTSSFRGTLAAAPREPCSYMFTLPREMRRSHHTRPRASLTRWRWTIHVYWTGVVVNVLHSYAIVKSRTVGVSAANARLSITCYCPAGLRDANTAVRRDALIVPAVGVYSTCYQCFLVMCYHRVRRSGLSPGDRDLSAFEHDLTKSPLHRHRIGRCAADTEPTPSETMRIPLSRRSDR